MRIQDMYQSALFMFSQQNDSQKFNYDFVLSLNEALQDFANSRKWGCLRTSGNITTVEDTASYALWSDFGTFYNVKGANRITSPSASENSVVEIVPYDQQYAREYSGTETGTPARAYIEGSSLILSPIPDGEYIIRFVYYKRPAEITQTQGDISDVPVKYHELIKRMVFSRLQESGYTSDREMAINEAGLQRLMSKAVKDDVATYGGPVMALYDDSYTNTVG